jgi:hypothetical protein
MLFVMGLTDWPNGMSEAECVFAMKEAVSIILCWTVVYILHLSLHVILVLFQVG